MWNVHNYVVLWMFFVIALLWDWNEAWLFSVLWPLLIFPNILTYLVQHLVSSFMIFNNSVGPPSPLLALFIVICSQAHLTSHSRMSISRWIDTPSSSSRSSRPFFYSSSVYSCHIFLISSIYVSSLPLLSFIVPILAWNFPLMSPIFLKRSLVFPILLFSSIS